MNLLRKIAIFASLSIMLCALSGGIAQAASPAKIVMRVGTPTTIKDIQYYEMEQFKKLLEEKIGDKISVELYPAGQLGSNAQMLQGIQAGAVHGLLEPTAFLGGFCSVANVVDLPYMFKDVWSATEILNTKDGDQLRDYLATREVFTASFYPHGDRITLINAPINSIKDLAGKKIRVMGAKVLQDQYASWGATGIPMDVPELYTALQQGTIDGLESSPTFCQQGKYFEVAKNLFYEPKGAEVTIFMLSKVWFDKLPEDIKSAIIETAKEVQPLADKQSRVMQEESIKIMKDAGVNVIITSPEFHDELVKRALSVHDIFLKDNPEAKPIYDHFKSL
ncbi:MAG: TRAP transporter substrate-binding protein [Synergistaceae bacterium]|jgi:C4-dicarboxylate-binding protein DctP|nr:TRAP transporter substrate-binding protein [Synergistaceae bacterium]